MLDSIDHPSHYQGASPIGRLVMAHMDIFDEGDFDMECIQWLESHDPIGMNFLFGNCLKYLWRAGNKGDVREDLGKALWYLDRFLSAETFRYNPYKQDLETARNFLYNLVHEHVQTY